jgi:putative oxidoreductase
MKFNSMVLQAIATADRIPFAILALIVRLGIADVFWRSGQTKVSGWRVTETTFQLLRDEYKVPLLLIVARGPGAISLDALIWRRFT